MVTSVNSKMTAIADAIRNLLDISGTMGLDAMASNISSITKRGAVAGTISTKSEQYIIPAGYHNGNGTVGIDVAEQAKIIAENIKNGVTILGVSGTASGDAYAVIAVTYPAGSVCTCTDGTKTLKLKDTSGQGIFLIPYAATWTVTCTDGTKTKSESVEITTEGQSEIAKLNYDVDALLAYQWKALAAHGTAYSITPATVDNHVMTCSATYQNSSNQGNVRFGAQDKIDFTDIDTIVVVINSWNIGNSKYPGTIGLVDSYDSTNPTYLAKYDINSSITAEKEVSIDVSAITGKHYLIVHNRASYDPVVTVTAKISKMILR